VQETLLKGFVAFEQFRGESTVRTWLTQIIINEISRHFRRNKRIPERAVREGEEIQNLDELIVVKLRPEEFRSRMERDEFWQVIWKCLEGTPPHLAQALVLRLGNDDAPIAEICAQLGISAANFSVRLFRARVLLRHCVEKKWLN
jgi:RNA polymerase sigma-70 factor, ECF subfamily